MLSVATKLIMLTVDMTSVTWLNVVAPFEKLLCLPLCLKKKPTGLPIKPRLTNLLCWLWYSLGTRVATVIKLFCDLYFRRLS